MESDRITRLQKEIDQFLTAFDVNEYDQVLFLFAYHRLLNNFSGTLSLQFSRQRERIDQQVRQFSPLDIAVNALAFRFLDISDRLISAYSELEQSTATRKDVIDAAVSIELLFYGFCGLCELSDENKVSPEMFYRIYREKGSLDCPIWDSASDDFCTRYFIKPEENDFVTLQIPRFKQYRAPEEETLEKKTERLQQEIDSFLAEFDSNSHEHIIRLFAYKQILSCFTDSTQLLMNKQEAQVESLVKSLSFESLESCYAAFDLNIYIDRFEDDYEKWKQNELTSEKLIDSAVYVMLIDRGFAGLDLCSLNYVNWMIEHEKYYRLTGYFVWNFMFDEYYRIYDFDSRHIVYACGSEMCLAEWVATFDE